MIRRSHNTTRPFGPGLRALLLTALLLTTSALSASAAQAATPAWRVLGVSGPTHIPPTQSETQRVRIDATDGDFTLTATTARGSGRLSFGSAIFLNYPADTDVIDVFSPTAGFEIGQAIISGAGIPAGTTIINVSGRFITLSQRTVSAGSFAAITAASRTVSSVSTTSGAFTAGHRISGTGIPAGTTISTVGSGTLTLSQFPTAGGTPALTATGTTDPIDFDASPSVVEARLDALGLDVAVTGGPGDVGASSPYLVTFGGADADQDVPQMSADSTGLLGGHGALATVSTAQKGGPGTATISVFATNVGGAPTSGQVQLDVGPLPAGITVSGAPTGRDWSCSVAAPNVSCTRVNPVVPAGFLAAVVRIPVQTNLTDPADLTVPITVSGGGANPLFGNATYQMPLTISPEPAGSGIEAAWAGAFDEDGRPATQAGDHPHSAAALFFFNTVYHAGLGRVLPAGGDARDISVEVPPGFLGNPLIVPRCPQSSLTSCGFANQVGKVDPSLDQLSNDLGTFENYLGYKTDLYPGEPFFGQAAQFTFPYVTTQQTLLAGVRSDSDFGATVTAPQIPLVKTLYGSYSILYGAPPGAPDRAFLINPTGCSVEAQGTDPVTRISYNTYQQPDFFAGKEAPVPPVEGCENLDFEAELRARPTTNVADSPTGLDVDLRIPQDALDDPDELVNPHLRDTRVVLPEGIAINPSGANGLDGCSSQEIGLLGTRFNFPHPIRFSKAPARCPDASKVGAGEVETPLLDHPLPATVYVADPFDNPFNRLLALYLEVNDPPSGIVAKIAGTVELDPRTGQIVSTFANNPQVPLEEVRLDFKGGAHAPLVTPPACGNYATRSTLTPWSAPESGPPVESVDAYQITQGPSGACAASASQLPHSPDLNAGSSSAIAGQYAPFVVNLSRADGTQRFKDVTVRPPLGLVAKLAGVETCSEAALAAAGSRDGVAEQASPSCPAASKLGDVYAQTGSGPDPYNAPGVAYLAGPYRGAPLSMAILTPAVAGPFDLGVVVVRTALHVNPATAEITAVSDPLPSILDGIPLNIRSASVRLNRPEFTKNPTSCDPMAVTGQLVSTLGNAAPLTDRFQVGECARLGFKPNLVLRLKGGTRRGRYPQLTATLAPRGGDANIRSVSVAFPRSEFLANEHIRTICTRPDFAADRCPAGSIYGTSTVTTPLLDYPLVGNVHLRSSSNLLPDVVPDLRGPAYQPIRVEAAGRTDSVRGGIRNTFDFLPDAPFTRAVLRMQGGNKGLLVNSRDICRRAYRAKVIFTAHNGATHTIKPKLIAQGCRGKRAKKAKRAAHRRAAAR